MNYPIWDVPASGLLIAVVAILHVFVSHFAVGGGLFLIVTEMKARRENDAALLDYLHRHSRFFILLTLVFGAVSGVGIWFTIGLVHPAATSSLINAFVWGWAIEWTFFLTEIAAAIVYYYGWERLTPRQHLAVGWIYFAAAFLSLVIINGILSYMLTPGAWLQNREFWSGFFNPTYWPSTVIRTLGSIGLAGVYALFTASWVASEELKRKLATYATVYWVAPMAIGLPFALLWYFAAAGTGGVPVAEIFGSASAGWRDLIGSVFSPLAITGHPVAQRALRTAFGSISVTVLLVFALFAFRRARYGRIATAVVMMAALVSIGASEWVRESLRKPFVIGSYVFVNQVRMPPPHGTLTALTQSADSLAVDHLMQAGVLSSAKWVRLSDATRTAAAPTPAQEVERGHEVFRLLCSQCHTIDGYVGIRRLVRGQSSAALEGVIGRLAVPRDASGRETGWDSPGVQLATWRNRRMPPFAGNNDERRELAVYLAKLGGGAIAPRAAAVSGEAVFDASCAMCHGADEEFPIRPRVAGRSEIQLYDIIGDLPARNAMMPPFEGTDAERRALAQYLAAMGGK